MQSSLRLGLLALLLAGMLAPLAQAQTIIPITNADFETGGVSDGVFSNLPGVIPTGWSTFGEGISGAYYGYYNPQDNAYTGATGASGVVGTMSGQNVFYFGSAVGGEGIKQTLSTTFAANTNYTLTVAVGARDFVVSSTNTAALNMELLAGSTVIASTVVRNTTRNTFADYSLNYDSAQSGALFSNLVGQALTIRFSENNTSFSGEMDIDNVRLLSTLQAVPEPSTWALLAGGLGLVVLVARRSRRA